MLVSPVYLLSLAEPAGTDVRIRVALDFVRTVFIMTSSKVSTLPSGDSMSQTFRKMLIGEGSADHFAIHFLSLR